MKRNALSLLCVMLLMALTALSACSSGVNGTYYDETGDLYIKINNGRWSMGEADGEEALSGPYVVEQGVFSFRSAVSDGEDMEIFTGKMDGNQLIVSFLGDAGTTVFYRDGKK